MASNNFDKDSSEGIPMKKMGPGTIAIGAAAVVIVGALIAFGAMGHKKKPSASEAQAEAVEASAEHAKEQAKEVREHLEITRKAMAELSQEQAAASASAAAAQPAQAEQAAPAEEHHAAAAPVHHAVSGTAAKKQINALDNLSKSITSQLGN
jgi:hypothetical protein